MEEDLHNTSPGGEYADVQLLRDYRDEKLDDEQRLKIGRKLVTDPSWKAAYDKVLQEHVEQLLHDPDTREEIRRRFEA